MRQEAKRGTEDFCFVTLCRPRNDKLLLTNTLIFCLCLFLLKRKKKRNRNLTVGNRKYLTDVDFIASSVPELKTLTLNSATRIKTPTKLFQPQPLWLQVSFQKMRMCSSIVVLGPLLAGCKRNHSLFS